jgi:hypothetical protein
MDREPEILQIVKARGPITARRIAALTGLKARLVRGALRGSKKTCQVDRCPNSYNKRSIWTYSETPIRPIKVDRVKKDVDVEQE